MRQQLFEERYAGTWHRLEAVLRWLDNGRRNATAKEAADVAIIPDLYRSTCQHLALAKTRNYSPALVQYLTELVSRGHQALYTSRSHWIRKAAQFVLYDFPTAVRKDSGLFWLSALLLIGSGIVMGWLAYQDPSFIYMLASREEVVDFEAMYDSQGDALGRTRGADEDWVMFGVYIWNNIGIAFQVFAMGVLFGIGTVFSLLFNGIYIGAIAGHLTGRGYGENFWQFVSGHGAFELTAIVIAGAAGLKLTTAFFAPGNRRRLDALRENAAESVNLIVGAGVMLFIAAFIEAFWSSSTTITPQIKYLVAAFLWTLVAAYLLLMGRRRVV